MDAGYDLLKLVTITGTIFSVYNAFTNRLLLEDLLIIIFAAILLIAISRDLGRAKNRNEEVLANAQKDFANVIEETIKKELV